jgi:hypothetical protein
MNWLASRVKLRMRTFLEVVDLGFVFVMANRRSYVRLALRFLLLPFAICAICQARQVPWPLIWAIALLLGALIEGPFTVAAGQMLFSRHVPWRAVSKSWWPRFGPYVSVRLRSTVLLALTGLIVLPLPVVMANVLFSGEACLLEGSKAGESLRRGARLAKGQQMRAFGLSLTLALVALGFVLLGEILGQGLVESTLQLGDPLGSLSDGGSTYALAGFFLAIPFLTAIRFVGYIDLRTRQEGWDIQLRFAALAQLAAERAAA